MQLEYAEKEDSYLRAKEVKYNNISIVIKRRYTSLPATGNMLQIGQWLGYIVKEIISLILPYVELIM